MGSKRVLTSIVLIPILYVVVWDLPGQYFTGLAVLATVIGLHEFYRMAERKGCKPLSRLGMVLGALLVVGGFYGQPVPDVGQAFYAALSVVTIMLVRLFSSRPVESAFDDIANTLLGIFYVALLFGFQVALHRGHDGKYWLMFMYLVIWASDTGAYYLGTAYGRHRLYERISPKKSIEGLVGALAASAGMALVCRAWFMPPLGGGEAVALGLALASVGTIGDLTESLFKRAADVKDSGSLIPGHGGLLDRMDSMLFAAPVLYYYLKMR